MTIATDFHDYQRNVPIAKLGGHCSPALLELLVAMKRRWPVESLGCYGSRAIRGGTLPSTHAYGAALDIDFGNASADTRGHMVAYLVAWSEEWGIQAVHDYLGSRIWRAGRTPKLSDACSAWWRAQKPDSNGMGSTWAHWFHVEVRPDRWWDGRWEPDRGIS